MRRHRRPRGPIARRPPRPSATRFDPTKRAPTNRHLDAPSKHRRTRRSPRASNLSIGQCDSRQHGLIGKIHVKLLLYSHAFAPSVGGVETIVATLARGLAKPPADKH